jgi:RNA polymerase sigma factor (TIGR02999 family)
LNSSTGEVTLLLRAWHAGEEDAYRRLSSLLYHELREQAAKYVRRRGGPDLLQPTALVHETFVRLTGADNVDWQDRRHFLAVAGRTMRRVLVDLFREQVSIKRGGGVPHVPLGPDVAATESRIVDVMALDQALTRLGALEPRKVQVIELRFFAGLTVEETAEVLGVAPDTVARDWRLARTWLLRELDTRARREDAESAEAR